VDGEEDLDPEHTGSVFNTVLNTINHEFEHECLEEAVSLVNTHPIRQSIDDRVPGLAGTNFLAQKLWAIRFIVRRRVSDPDMAGALVVVEMDVGKNFTSVAAVMICKLLTEKVVMGLPLSIMWGNTLAK